MKKKILIVAAAALVTLGLATVSAQSPVRVQSSENFVFSVVEAPRYGAGGATVDENDGNVTLDVELKLRGDVDGDGDMDSYDISALLRHVAKIEYIEDEYALKCCDVDSDGDLDSYDISALLRHVAKIEYLPGW